MVDLHVNCSHWIRVLSFSLPDAACVRLASAELDVRCAGTNFLIRAAAFKEAGWSPEYTLTEDFALGMELKKRKWQCRYVEEYLAVGEAPDEVRNCFQQRSRWAKGVRGRPDRAYHDQSTSVPASSSAPAGPRGRACRPRRGE